MYIPIPAPSKVDTIKDQLPKNWLKIIFKTAVIKTKSAICLFSLTAGVKIATNNAYKEILKLLVTITGYKFRVTTPIAAPKHQLNQAVMAIPKYIQIDES